MPLGVSRKGEKQNPTLKSGDFEMLEIICSRSGLKFEAENRRKKVHPAISYYTCHKNYDIRYPAIAVIERGKTEGWDSIEKFEEEIEKALNPEPQPRPDYDFEGAWAAEITGSDKKYRFERTFLTKVDEEGRFKRYSIIAEGDGIYETCYKSAKGNQTRRYWQVKNGELTQISLEEVEILFPEIKPVSVEGCVKVEKFFPENSPVEYEGQIYFVVRVDSVTHWEDEDGVAGTGYNNNDTYTVWEDTVFTSYLRPATSEESAQYEEIKQAKLVEETQEAERKEAVKRLKEIAKTITVSNGAITPESASYPNGKAFVLEQGYYQPNRLLVLEHNRLWSLRYNGRDGDDWSYNNVAGSCIGCYLEITPELKTEIEELIDKC